MSMAQKLENSDTLYLTIVGWTMVEKSEEGVEGAKKRDYETSDGKTGVKWEIHYKNLLGRITWLEFKNTDYGEQFTLTLSGSEWQQAKLSMNTDSRYFTDFGKKLPNINLEEEIELNSYDFKTPDGKQLRWLSIKQDGQKINDFYWDGKKALNNMPNVSKTESKDYDKDDWKMFFIKIKKFLKSEIEKVKLPKITVSEEEINRTDIDDVFE